MISNWLNNYILLLLLTFSAGKIAAQDSYCASTDPVTGEITLTWHWDSYATVSSYKVKWGISVTNPTDSITLPVSGPDISYTIPLATGTNGLANQYYFHLTGSGSIPPLDIVFSNILLTVTPFAPGIARLSWNEVFYPNAGTYHVERYDNTFWNTLADVVIPGPVSSPFVYNDTVTFPFCSFSLIKYRIAFEQTGASTCTAVSNTGSGTFKDETQPKAPLTDTVSIYNDPLGTNTAAIILGWTNSPSGDVIGYQIYRSVTATGSFDSIGYVSSGVNQYIDLTAVPCFYKQEYYYAIVSTDGCKNGTPNIYHAISPHNLVLDLITVDPCERIAHLSWNNYDNMPGGIGGYIIYRQINLGSIVAIDTVNNATTSYTDSTRFVNGTRYEYYVRAYSATGAGSSSSCINQITYSGPLVPDTLYIKQASVVNNSSVEVKYYYSPQDTIRQLLLERADTPAGPFIPVDSISASGNDFLPPNGTMTDPTAKVNNQSYVYRLTVMTVNCIKPIKYSDNTARTIYLTCDKAGSSTFQLKWNEYGNWYMSAEGYEVFRLLNGSPDPNWVPVPVTTPPFEYTDDLQSVEPGVQVCYYIVSRENAGNPIAPDASSTSNTACAIQEPVFDMPNAFRPDGIYNRFFKPVTAYVETASFEMQIFNKWGQMIFETNDIFNGWNGTVNGILAPCDVYVYRVAYKSVMGNSYEKRGMVTLLR